MKYILVTGSAQNTGRDIALDLAQKGKNIILQYRDNKKKAMELALEIEMYGVKAQVIYGDFSEGEKVLSFIEELNKLARSIETFSIEGIINCVGYYEKGDLITTSCEIMKKMFQTNLFAPYEIIKAFLSDLKNNNGFIINLGMCGINSNKADTYATAYQMSKIALFNLTKSLAISLAPYKVSVNMISPGYLESSVDVPKDITAIPMGRMGKSSEIVNTVSYLFSHSYVTGQNIEVAGGVRL